jgi:hypothetical protein
VNLLPCLLVAGTSTAAAQTFTLSAKPVVQIGSDASAVYQFNRIESLRRLSDGRIVVTMGPDIRFFDPSGKYLAKAGGRGRGPGEFAWVSGLQVLPGDTLLMMNVRTIVWLDREGKFIRQVLPDLAPLATDGWFSEGSVPLPNGNLLAPQYSRVESNSRSPVMRRAPVRYVVLDLATGKVTPLVTGGGLAQMTHNGRQLLLPFTLLAQQAIGADRVYAGDNDSTFIQAFTLDGKPVGRFTVAEQPTPVTAADLAAYKQMLIDWATQNKMPLQAVEQDWADTPKPSRHPYWGSAIVDAAGVLWVSGPSRQDKPTQWSAFDRAGRRLGSIVLPANFTPKDIGIGYVLGVQRDEVGVETIAMYSLRRGR